MLGAVAGSCMIAILIVIGLINNHIVPIYPKPHFHYNAEPNNPLKFLSNWDGPDYIRISRFNYRSLFDASFYPLYPALIYFFTIIFRSPLITALIISWSSLFGALYFFIKILRHLGLVHKPYDALTAVSFLLLFPTGVFFLATYTESLFAFLSLAAIYYALKKHWAMSALLLIIAGTAHITALLVIGLVCLILIEEKVKIWQIGLNIAAGLAGTGIFAIYQQYKYHDAFAFLKSQAKIHRWLHHGLVNLWYSLGAFNALSIVLIILSAIYFWNKRKSFSLYALSFLLIPLIGGQYGGFNRYVIVAFPVEFMLYRFCRDHEQVYPYLIALSAILWTVVALEYTGGYIGS